MSDRGARRFSFRSNALDARLVAARGGHIPGAINLDWLELMDHNNNLQLKPLHQLQAELNRLGLTKDKRIITHCQSHHRSGLTWLVAKARGALPDA